MSLLDSLKKSDHFQFVKNEKNSFQWLRREIKKQIKQVSAPAFFKQNIDNAVTQSNMVPGNMYMYTYDPKWKKKLPYWDIFPLMIPLYRKMGATGQMIVGVNLHWVPPFMRAQFLDKLYRIQNIEELPPQQIRRIVVESIPRKVRKLAIRQYYFSHIRSRPIKVPFEDWKYVIFLPLAKIIYQKDISWRST